MEDKEEGEEEEELAPREREVEMPGGEDGELTYAVSSSPVLI